MNEADRPTDGQYRTAFAVAPNAYVLVDADFVVVDANPRWLRTVGRAASEVLGRGLFESFPNDPDRPDSDVAGEIRRSIAHVLATGDPDVRVAYRYDVADDCGRFEPRWWNITSSAVPGSDGRPRLVLNFIEDVTDWILARQAGESAGELPDERVRAVQDGLLDRAQQLQAINSALRLASEHDRTVARALQDAMLTRLPEPPDLQLAARYLTAAQRDQVGGDWYDAVTLPDGTTVVVIGDVVGHDIEAAALMGQVRSMLRAFAWDGGRGPAATVAHLDRAVRDLSVPVLATLVTAVIGPPDPVSGRVSLVWTNAGHPPPVLLAAGEGTVTALTPGDPDLMVGVDAESPRRDHSTVLTPGDTVLLYTDGLVEVRGEDLSRGQELLLDAAGRHRRLEPESLVDAVIATMVGEHPQDDVAVLAVRVGPPASPGSSTH